MKKIVAVLLAVVLAVSSMISAFASQTPSIVMGKADFETKDEIKTLTVEARNLENISVIQFTVVYDSSKFELQNVSDGSNGYAGTVIDAAKNGIIPDATVSCLEPGKVNIVWDSEVPVSGTGNLVELKFKALVDGAGSLGLEVSTDEDDFFAIKQADEENKDIGDIEVEITNPGYTVSGTVTSYLDTNGTVTIGLYSGESTVPAYETTVTGNSGTYSISEVEPGTYTMKVTKEKHVPAEYEIVVGTENVVQNIKLVLRGDVNGDGNINMTDVSLIRRYLVNSNNYPLTNRDAADINKDGNINMTDVSLIRRYLVNSTLYPIN